MPDETGRLPDRPGGDAQGALESAACQLRASPPPAAASPAREREILRRRQERDLLAWAREQGRLIERATYLTLAERGGEEHRLWLAEDGRRYFKATFPGRFGFAVILAHAGIPDLADATPLEYLERLILQNRVFGDSVCLEGVTQEAGGTAIVTSQPHLAGTAPVREEILSFMSRLWFRPLRGLHLGRPGSLAFYRDLDEVAVFDAHPGNFVKDAEGIVLPIDLILLHAGEALQAALNRYLG